VSRNPAHAQRVAYLFLLTSVNRAVQAHCGDRRRPPVLARRKISSNAVIPSFQTVSKNQSRNHPLWVEGFIPEARWCKAYPDWSFFE